MSNSASSTQNAVEGRELPASVNAARRPWREVLLVISERYALVALTVVVVIVFSTIAPSSDVFLSKANLTSILANQSVLAIVALATFIPLICGEFDLSLGAVLGISSLTAATLMSQHGWAVMPAVAAAVAVGALCGLVSGSLVAIAKVNSLIATLAMATFLAGVITGVTGGESIVTGIPQGFVDFGSGTTVGIPNAAWAVCVVGVVVAYLVNQTPFGRYVLAVGSNARAAFLAGLNVKGLVVACFVLAGVVAGAAGALQVARSGGANPQIGPGYALPAFAAVFLGSTAFRPGRYTVRGTITAVVFLALLTSGLTLSGVPDYVNDIVVSLALVTGVALSSLLARHRNR